MKTARYHRPIPFILLLLYITGSTLAVSYFTQTFPSVAPSLNVNCTSLNPLSATIANGTKQGVTFNCGGTTSAFNVLLTTNLRPTFTLGVNWLNLELVTAGTNATMIRSLQTGFLYTNITIGNYNYVAQYSGTGTTGSFTIGWGT